MHTEHLQNVAWGRVVAGWFIAIAMVSFIILGAIGLGLVDREEYAGNWLLTLVAFALGFWTAGFFIGNRTASAPILHGVALGMMSLLAWFVLNVVAVAAFEGAEWQALSPMLSAGVILLQMLAAVLGGWMGYRSAQTSMGLPPTDLS